jgi:hypothetical protein
MLANTNGTITNNNLLMHTTIRLLRIMSRPGESPRCSLEDFDIRNDLQYDCLSYTWGEPLDNQLSSSTDRSDAGFEYDPIVELEDGTKVEVTPNLYDALQHLSLNGYSQDAPVDPETGKKKSYLWIDALCIDQTNTDE